VAEPIRSTPRRRATLADVAAHVGVSTTLVSLVMRDVPGASPANRERIRRAAEDLGYRPDSRAQLLRRSRSRLIGVVFRVQDPFDGDLVGGLYRAADDAYYELALSAVAPGRDERRAVASLLQDRCEALILLAPRSPTSALAELAGRMPTVVVARSVRHRALDVVRTDNAAGLHLAVDHLVALGHSRTAHIDGGRAPGAAERRRGYREAVRRHGLTGSSHILSGGPTEDDGAAAAQAMLDIRPRPTAVTVFNDRCATGVLDVLSKAGISVPARMSVIGFDDSRLARLSHLDLTTVAQDVRRMSHLAVTRADARLDDSGTGADVGERELVVPPHLVVRGTTAPPADTPSRPAETTAGPPERSASADDARRRPRLPAT
jgi:DNA-binding LacI/PurR family transcriptional regulator